MNALPTLLWKEWRDHRVTLLAFPLAIAPVIALGVGLLPSSSAKNPSLPTLAMFGVFAIVALTLIADLLPSEEQRGTIAFLRRLPGGLARVFVAKTFFALLVIVALCGIGYLWTTLASATLRGGPWFPRLELGRLPWMRHPAGYTTFVEWWPLMVVVAVWMVPVSTMVPRGALALPATVFLLALLAAPIALAFARHPGMLPSRNDLLVTWIGLLVAAPIVAVIAFVFGRSRGGGLGASAWRGLLLTVVLFTPAYARVARHASLWDRLDPTDKSFRIDRGSFVGSSGRYAFLTVRHRLGSEGPEHAIAVDLADGSWQEVGQAGERIVLVGNCSSSCSAVPFVARRSDRIFGHTYPGAEVADQELSRWVVLDTATLATKAVAAFRNLPDPFRATEEASASERAVNAIWLPDGRRVWMRDRQLVTEAVDRASGAGGDVRVLLDSKMERLSSWAHPIGHGMSLFGSNGVVIYDALRERRCEIRHSMSVVFVRPGRWLVQRDIDEKHHREQCLFDPDTQECTPLPPPIAKSEFCGMVDDGRLLAISRLPKSPRFGTLALVDPESGAIEPLELPEWFGGRLHHARVEGRTPSGALVVELAPDVLGGGWCHARLDFAARRLVAAGDSSQSYSVLLGCPDEETLYLVMGEQRLLRARFGAPEMELVFPNAEGGRR